MEVRWTRRARRRFGGHATYLAAHSPRAADELLQRVHRAVARLADNPLLGREGRYLGTRELAVEGGRYIIVYRVREQVVQIVTVHDARQQWPEDPTEA